LHQVLKNQDHINTKKTRRLTWHF